MGIIVDSSILIAAERQGRSVYDIVEFLSTSHGETDSGLSVVAILELSHGIYRAKTLAQGSRRETFVRELCVAFEIYPVTLEIAQLAARLSGEQAAQGVSIAIPDLLIGATALHLGYAVATHNLRHFRSIPGLTVVQF